MSSIVIRSAEEKDLAKIRELLHQVCQVHAEGRPDLFKAGGIKYTDEELLAIFQDEHRPVYVAVRDGQVAGYAFCALESSEETTSTRPVRTLYIDDLCVDEAARGQGIGRMLYNRALEAASALGCDRVTLHAWNFNQAAFGFYEKLGMTPLVTTMEQKITKS